MQKKSGGKNNLFKLAKKEQNTADVQTFSFAPVSGKVFAFEPGEYVTLYFLNDAFAWQGKSYSIVSLPGEKYISITVKKMGKFSEAIHNLKIGDRVTLAGPDGLFHIGDHMQNVVFLAGGIGITPIYNIVDHIAKSKEISQKNMSLFYSNKKKEGIVFFEELKNIAKKIPHFQIIHTLTDTSYKDPGIEEFKRIDEQMLKKYKRLGKENYYFICGPISFTNELWKILSENKIPESHIITEAFY